jgi:hypothetical protein
MKGRKDINEKKVIESQHDWKKKKIITITGNDTFQQDERIKTFCYNSGNFLTFR